MKDNINAKSVTDPWFLSGLGTSVTYFPKELILNSGFYGTTSVSFVMGAISSSIMKPTKLKKTRNSFGYSICIED